MKEKIEAKKKNQYVYNQEGDNLEKNIDKKQENLISYDEQTVLQWSEGIVNGIDYLHSQLTIHRDIKPEYDASYLK